MNTKTKKISTSKYLTKSALIGCFRFLKKRAPLLILLTLIAVLFLLPEAAAAAPPKSTATVLDETFAKVTSIFKIMMDVLSLLLWPVILMIGGLIQNDMIFGGGMEDRLRIVWVEVRNLINIVFVIYLVGLAFYNALGIGEDKIKSELPKLIVAIIAINFTFLATKVVLDAANVVTVAIFSIPQSIDPAMARIQPNDPEIRKQFHEGICTALYDSKTGASEPYIQEQLYAQAKIDAAKEVAKNKKKKVEDVTKSLYATYKNPSKSKYKELKDSLLCIGTTLNFQRITGAKTKEQATKNEKFFFSLFDKYDANNASLAMALNLQKTYKIKNVQIGGKFDKLTLNIIFSVILFAIYASAYVALFAVLLVRVLVMWICIIFSPLFVFSSKVGGLQIPGVSQQADEIFDLFVKHLRAPIVIAVVMTVGFIMLKSLQGADHSVGILDKKTGQFNLPTSGLDTFKEFLIAIATCGIVWMGVFKAAEDTMAKAFTGGIQNIVGGLGKFLLKAPQYLPIIPIKKTGAGKAEQIPLASVLSGFGNLSGELEDRAKIHTGRRKFYNMLLGGDKSLANMKFGDSGASIKESRQLVARYKNQPPKRETLSKFEDKQRFITGMRKIMTKETKDITEKIIKQVNAGKQINQTDWQTFYQKAKLSSVTAAPDYTGPASSTAAGATAAAASNIVNTFSTGANNVSDISSSLQGTDKTLFDAAVAKAKEGDAAFNTYYQGLKQEEKTKLEELRGRVHSVGVLPEKEKLTDATSRNATLKEYAKRLTDAKLNQTQIKARLTAALTDAEVPQGEQAAAITAATGTST